MTILDARGISCPEPMVMLKQALNNQRELTLMLDSKNALANCEEYAKKQNCTVTIKTEGDEYELHIKANG
ncbi:MAG: sulfurtransferase TusA family protein [Defluviitaleaceae bacterium]|nr:sulfurtransferase TusA family protein [Defluviitaleaceae bacterium]